MFEAIPNKHLCNIVNSYLSMKCVYLDELIEKTEYGVLTATDGYIYYSNYKIFWYPGHDKIQSHFRDRCNPANKTGYYHKSNGHWAIDTFG
jgi:hypothetical protein